MALPLTGSWVLMRGSTKDCRSGSSGARGNTPHGDPRSRCVSHDRRASCVTSAASGITDERLRCNISVSGGKRCAMSIQSKRKRRSRGVRSDRHNCCHVLTCDKQQDACQTPVRASCGGQITGQYGAAPTGSLGHQDVSTSDCSAVIRGSTAASVRWWLSLVRRSVRPVSPLSRVQASSCMPTNILRMRRARGH